MFTEIFVGKLSMLGVLWTLLATAIGAALGVSSAMYVSVASGRKAMRAGAPDIPQNVSPDVYILTRRHDDSAAELIAARVSTAIGPAGFSIAAICAYFMGNISPMVAFAISYGFLDLFGPRLEKRQQIMTLIRQILQEKHCPPEHTKKVSRCIYKTIKSWVKPGRNYEEYYIVTTLILGQYLQGESLITSPEP